jgi:iron complex transport system ATP-binding protein
VNVGERSHQLDVIEAARCCARRGVTVVAILHDLNLAAMLADRILVLNRGRIDDDASSCETITDAMLARVFGVVEAVGIVPTDRRPFVLPHAARKIQFQQD